MPTTKRSPTTKRATKKSSTPKRAAKKPSTSSRGAKSPASGATKKWSSSVTKHSNALDLDKGIFKSKSANKIAHSLEDSAEKSTRKKSGSYQSAMSMLNFYINRAGKNLPAKQKAILTEAKNKLKALHEKEDSRHHQK